MGIPLLDQDEDFAEEVDRAEFMRHQYNNGIFQIEGDSEHVKTIKQAVDSLKMATFYSRADEQEKIIEVPDQVLKDYANFERYMIEYEQQRESQKNGRRDPLNVISDNKRKLESITELHELDQRLEEIDEDYFNNSKLQKEIEDDNEKADDGVQKKGGEDIQNALAHLKHVEQPGEDDNNEMMDSSFESSDEAIESTLNRVEALRARIDAKLLRKQTRRAARKPE